MGVITPTETLAQPARRGQLLKLASRATVATALVLAGTVSVLAHDPGLSALDVRVDSQEIVASVSLAAADVQIAGGREVAAKVARDTIEIALDGRQLSPAATSMWSDESGGMHLRIEYRREPGSRLLLRSGIVTHLARGHRELVSVRTGSGTLLLERMLDADSNEVSADISHVASDSGSSFGRFFALGVRHILTGYDHLLFLAGALVVLRRWRDVIKTITAFTLSHSITLAFAITGLVVVSSRIVEPLIAASIVYVGVENFFRRAEGSRWKLTFCFGLVHGLGFATALRDVGVGAGGHGSIVVPLASFNGGVEAGQIAVACLLVPLFWWLNSRSNQTVRFAYAWSLLVAVAGGFWLIERMV